MSLVEILPFPPPLAENPSSSWHLPRILLYFPGKGCNASPSSSSFSRYLLRKKGEISSPLLMRPFMHLWGRKPYPGEILIAGENNVCPYPQKECETPATCREKLKKRRRISKTTMIFQSTFKSKQLQHATFLLIALMLSLLRRTWREVGYAPAPNSK